MDTKLKKMHRKTLLIIALLVILPALLLTALYPRMEAEYQRKLKQYEEQEREIETAWEYSYGMPENFVNYATEAIYFKYAAMLQEQSETEVRVDVLEEYGWIFDYDYVNENTDYLIAYDTENSTDVVTNTNEDLSVFLGDPEEEILNHYREEGYVAYFTVKFDQYGKIKEANFKNFPNSEISEIIDTPYYAVKNSIEQYEGNVEGYNSAYNLHIDANELHPKNVSAVFLVHESSDFVWANGYNEYMYYTEESIYVENGVFYIIAALMIFVALAALILPLFKKLETGWEGIFSMPFEVATVFFSIWICVVVGMFEVMTESRFELLQSAFTAQASGIEILGWSMEAETAYAIILFLNFLGWMVCFAMEYILVAHVRQFLCSPKYYMKNRLLLVIFCRWIVKKIKQLYQWVMDIDIAYELNRSITKIVLVNFAILVLLCCMWVIGIAGLILYSIGLYILLRKYGEQVQTQYNSILHATQEMAEGNLKIELEEELGIFEPLGEELERVQEGFAKAVREEAKSQNMKTELITNVSHDLKTPLTAIITYVDLLKQEGITEEQRKSYIDTLEQKSQRLKALIEDLFEVSKANSGNVKMNFMEVDVINLMKQVRLEMEDKIMNSNLNFRWNLPEEKVILSLDGQRTYRIFENLLNNILKYAMEGSRVYVDIIDTENEVKIVFRNISAAELDYNVDHLTERFVRGDASRNSEGSGLGLAIVKSFVELQNGTFNIEVDGDLFKAIIVWEK